MFWTEKDNLNSFGMLVRRGELIACKVALVHCCPTLVMGQLDEFFTDLCEFYAREVFGEGSREWNVIRDLLTVVAKHPPSFEKAARNPVASAAEDESDDFTKMAVDPEAQRRLFLAALAALSSLGASGITLNRSFNRNRSSKNRSSANRNRKHPAIHREDIPTALGWREIRRFYGMGLSAVQKHQGGVWENLDLLPPPGPNETMDETSELIELQGRLKESGQEVRRREIVAQAGYGLAEYIAPLGIDEAGGFDATRQLLAIILDLTNEIGFAYKNRFSRLRPNIVQPLIRPFIAVPNHASYPSNHAYQSFSIAETFARIHPEHPGVAALFRRAQRVAENREWAGLHYRSDTEAGRDLAKQTVAYLAEVLDELLYEAQREWIA